MARRLILKTEAVADIHGQEYTLKYLDHSYEGRVSEDERSVQDIIDSGVETFDILPKYFAMQLQRKKRIN